MDRNTAIVVICCGFFFVSILGLAASVGKERAQAQVKLACYEAAKTNANIKCGDE